VRLRVIGDRSRLDADFVALIERAEKRTGDNTKQTLVIALDYGSRREITQAARRLAEEVKAGTLDPNEIDETAFAARLYPPTFRPGLDPADIRRVADQQFPLVAIGLRRTRFHRDVVAGFHQARPGGGD